MFKKFKKITPFLLLGICSLIFVVYKLIFDRNEYYEIDAFIFCVIGVAILISDFILKKWLKTLKKIVASQFILIGIVFILDRYNHNRTKTLEISQNFDKQFVTIIYNVNGELGLEIKNYTWFKTIQIPNNGILKTSSKIDEDLPLTKIKTSNNIYLNSISSNKNFAEFGGKFELRDKVYKYKSWQIGSKDSCCSHSGENIQKYEII